MVDSYLIAVEILALPYVRLMMYITIDKYDA
jgi:hypothetical protein